MSRLSRLEVALRVAFAVGIVIQVAQRFAHNGFELSRYGKSLWYVTYEFGFVRRGLAGELLRQVVGSSPTSSVVDIVQNVIGWLVLMVAAAFVVQLCRLRTTVGYTTAALLVVAPFCFDFVGGSRRPDLAAFLLLGGVGLWSAARRPAPVTLALAAGAVLGATTLFSEAGPLMVGPWLVLVVCANARAQGASMRATTRAVIAVTAPSTVVLAVLAVVGRATPAMIHELESKAPLTARGSGTVFPYLDDTISTSISKVMNHPGHLELSIIVGLVLVALMLGLVWRHLHDIFTTLGWVLPSTALRATWLAGAAGTAVILFALGFDWLRWFASIGLGALLAIATIVVMLSRSRERPTTRGAWDQRLPNRVDLSPLQLAKCGLATALLALPPLHASIS